MTDFEIAMDFVALHEWGKRADGEYTNIPTDAGGETKYGIAKRAHPDVDIKNLTLADALAIYRTDYWNANNIDQYSMPLKLAVFDSYIQHGPKKTQQFLVAAGSDWQAFVQARIDFYLALIDKNPAQIIFKRGWMNRMVDLRKLCEINTPQTT